MSSIKSGSPLDPAAPGILERGVIELLPVFKELLKSSFMKAHVPQSWKHASVVPLLKKPTLDPSKPENYRLISLLPFLSKVAEKHINHQLSGFIEEKDLRHSTQSGLHPWYSTESVLLLASESLHHYGQRGHRSFSAAGLKCSL